jgi:hypothetical protein
MDRHAPSGHTLGKSPVHDVRTGFTSRSNGQSLVEFALVLPLFLIMTIGIVDMARIFSANVNLADGVRKAALWAAEGTNYDKWCRQVASPPPGIVECPTEDIDGNPVDPTSKVSPDPDNIAFQLRSVGLDAARITMRAPFCRDTLANPAACASDGTVQIAASYPEVLLTPILGAMFGGQILISQSTTARIEPP